MVEVLTALRTVTGHLVKALMEGREDYGDLESQTVPVFMLNLYEHLNKPTAVLYEIGIHSALSSHIACLSELPVTSAYSALKLFFNWVNEGYYDFSDVPFSLKVHMTYQDTLLVEQKLQMMWSSTIAELLKEVHQLVDVLKHSEKDIVCKVNQASNKPILDYLLEYHMLQEDDDLLTRYIPRTIMLHHYVALRLSLRRLLLKVHREEASRADGEGGVDIWSEFISDLWEKHLPHLREELYGEGMFVFNANTGCYGFQEDDEEDINQEEESRAKLMATLLMDAATEEEEEGTPGSFRIQEPLIDDSLGVVSEGHHTYDLDRISDEEDEDNDGGGGGGDGGGGGGGGGGEGDGEGGGEGGEEQDKKDEEDLGVLLKKNPELKKMLSIIQTTGEKTSELEKMLTLVQSIEKGTSLEGLARQFSAEDVSLFLTKINLPQYSEAFVDKDISGEVLLEADTDFLLELGVDSPLHQMKIIELFRRELQRGVAKYDTGHVTEFLHCFRLDKYGPALEEHGIDGDMILGVDEKLMKSVLREVGVASLVDIGKIRARYKTFVSDNP